MLVRMSPRLVNVKYQSSKSTKCKWAECGFDWIFVRPTFRLSIPPANFKTAKRRSVFRLTLGQSIKWICYPIVFKTNNEFNFIHILLCFLTFFKTCVRSFFTTTKSARLYLEPTLLLPLTY